MNRSTKAVVGLGNVLFAVIVAIGLTLIFGDDILRTIGVIQ